MRFFDREKEIAQLKRIRQTSFGNAQFTVITGRRRIGKTSLVLEAYRDEPFLYFFVSRKDEAELCLDYCNEITSKLGIPILAGTSRFAQVFEYVMQLSKTRPITLVIDEFQEFMRINSSVYSEMQRIWDLNKRESKMNLLVCGSVYSLMSRLFRDSKESLFGRNTGMMNLKAFTPEVLAEILHEYSPAASNEDLLALYLFTGGVAKYVETFIDNKVFTRTKMLDFVTREGSPFIDEGKLLLIDEFGKDYGAYFSILSLVAQGYNTRGQLEDILKKEIGGYLTNLERNYGLLAKHQPIFENTANKGVRYALNDNFLRFWFRFMYKYNYMTEIGAHDKLKQIIARDYNTYSGPILENYFKEKLMEQQLYTRMGYWHDRQGNNEIDIIGIDEIERRIDFYEVKRQAKSIDLAILRSKAEAFLTAHKALAGYSTQYLPLSLNDM